MDKKIFICAGDVSGDEHAGRLVEELKKINPSLTIFSCGGEKLKSKTNFICDLVGLSAFGFLEPLREIFTFRNILKKIIQPLLVGNKIDLVVLVDYYGFNVHVARLAKELAIPVVYYISPQVWASRPGRIKVLAKLVKKMLVIFPFEEEVYRKSGLEAVWVGHPLMDKIPEPNFSSQNTAKECLIGLFPGSRRGEVVSHLPIMEKTVRLIIKQFPQAYFVIFAASAMAEDLINNYWAGDDLPVSIVRDHNYSFRRMLKFAIVVSGTVTLENACLGIPMLVIYRTNWPTYFLAKQLIKIRYISIVNLLAGREIVPEFIQRKAAAENLAAATVKLLKNPDELEQFRQQLLEIRKKLGAPGANRKAAEIILGCLGEGGV
ncbi:MAG: lipid-A-disaccharide synthase [Elusimicrobiota bacterium]